jgi:hypothetical protein
MKSHTPFLVVGFFVLFVFLLPSHGFAAARPRLIVLAVDQSGSMKTSDPARFRVEATSMLVSLANDDDRIGLIGFGDNSEWIQKPIEKRNFDLSRISTVKEDEPYTGFSSAFALWQDYLSHLEASFFQTHDSFLLVFTDGRSDPRDHDPARDRSESLQAVSDMSGRGRVFVVGLGHDLDGTFLDELANRGGGTRSDAASAATLPDAFLRVATKILALPVYDRIAAPGPLRWQGAPDRVFSVFIGSSADSFSSGGTPSFRGRHIAVNRASASAGETVAVWQGGGSAFLCVNEPLRFELEHPLPDSMLTDSAQPADLRVVNRAGPLASAYFLQEGPLNNISADLLFDAPGHSELVPATPGSEDHFHAQIRLQQNGLYKVTARLRASYGGIETYLGEIAVRTVPVTLPEQQDVPVFDPLPRTIFAPRLVLRSELPTGIVKLSFTPTDNARVNPDEVLLTPGQTKTVTLTTSGVANTVMVVDYIAVWQDGNTAAQRRGTLHLLVKQMTLVELLRAKWGWGVGILVFLLLIVRLIALLSPRPIRGTILVLLDSRQVCRLTLPRQGRRRSLTVRATASGSGLSGDTLRVASDRECDLVSFRSVRKGARWVVYAIPHDAALFDLRGPASAANPMHELVNPHFKTRDGQILIRFLS